MQNNLFNAYEILDIQSHANATQIKSAYKKKALEYHPDKYNNSRPANAMFRLIVQAKDILLHPPSRLEHDYAIGIKKRPVNESEPEVIYINESNDETDWGSIIGAGLVGLAIGASLRRRKKKKKK